MIDRSQIEEIRRQTDLVELVRGYVTGLVKSGKTFKGLCPFHSERTPSFHVNPEIGVFKCFGCGEGGDSIRFLMRIEHLDFPEAAAKLAEQAGIVLKIGHSRSPERESETARLHRLLSATAQFYEKCLSSAAGQTARRYLESRGVREDSLRRFGLGLAPRTGETALENGLKAGFSMDELQKAGVASRHPETGRLRDPLGGRLVFPIHDAMGHVAGFGGRLLEEAGKTPWSSPGAGPKYLNSPDTAVFKKGTLLYGLTQAKKAMSQAGRVLIVEGYMDVIACHQAGVEWTVAPLGTALTSDHARALKRYVRETVLFFDPDAAGREAARRSLGVLLPHDLFVRIAPHPDARDADEYIAAEGTKAWSALLAASQDGVEMTLEERLASLGSSPGLHERVRIAEEMLAYVSETPNDILKQEWVKRIAQRLSLEEAGLWRKLGKPPRPSRTARAPEPGPARNALSERIGGLEAEILRLLVTEPACWELVTLSPRDFPDALAAEIFTRMTEIRAEGGSLTGLFDCLGPAAQEYFTALAAEERTFPDPADYFATAVRRLKRMKLQREIRGLESRLSVLGGGSEREEAVQAYRQLLKEIARLDRGEVRPNPN